MRLRDVGASAILSIVAAAPAFAIICAGTGVGTGQSYRPGASRPSLRTDYSISIDGNIVEKSECLDYPQGSPRSGVPGLDDALRASNAGENKRIVLPPERAFGMPDPDAIATFESGTFPPELAKIGAQVAYYSDGERLRPRMGRVVDVKPDGSIVVDFNHPWAGKTVVYDLTISAGNCCQ